VKDPQGVLEGWNKTASNARHFCSWKGVSCNEGLQHVLSLDLSNSNLTGNLNTAVGSLHFLSSLNLSSNNFSGDIPSNLGQCIALTALDLSSNIFSGNIPREIGNLSNLVTVDLFIKVLLF
jgi:Leucine-rich repeat (LRR) protein